MSNGNTYALSALREKHVRKVLIADLAVSNDPGETIVTYALGSCIAVTMYDPLERVGGLVHYLLPSSDISRDTHNSPLRYADTAIAALLEAVRRAGAVKRRLVVKAIGGAMRVGQHNNGAMNIGEQNRKALLAGLAKQGLKLTAAELGGQNSRTAMLEIDTGMVTIRSKQKLARI